MGGYALKSDFQNGVCELSPKRSLIESCWIKVDGFDADKNVTIENFSFFSSQRKSKKWFNDEKDFNSYVGKYTKNEKHALNNLANNKPEKKHFID